MGIRLQLKHDSAAAWASLNTILRPGEIGYDTTNDKFVFGDGVTAWNSWTSDDFFTKIDDANVVHDTGNETVAGIKTFSSSPIVPTPSTSTQAANKSYVDSVGGGTTNNYTVNLTGGNMVAASSFANAAALITAIGSVQTTILLDADLDVAAPATFPANIVFLQDRGKFVKSGTGSITFLGIGVIGDSPTLLFSGFTTVKWTGPYPDPFRTEWFGALGDNSHDDLPAFNACHDAMQAPNTHTGTILSGGHILLRQGVTYFLNGTLHIRRPYLMDNGTTADYNQHVTKLRFPSNTPGVILHGTSTFDGTASTTQTGQGADVSGIVIVGAAGGNNTVLSTSGLNLTLTGGSITSVSRRGDNTGTPACITPGSTVTINGYDYVVSDSLSATATSTVPIEAPRTCVQATNGSPTVGIADFSAWPSNNDWAGQTIEIGDDAYTISSHTTTTITLSANYTGTTGFYTATITTGIKSQVTQNARLNIYHGIDVRSQVKLRHLRATGFAGNGLDMNSERYPSAFLGTEPNGNNAYFERISCDFNKGSGFAYYGVNSNNFETHSLNSENNNGWGFYENATLGANHFSWHNAYNAKGAFKFAGNGASVIVACYTEGGQPSAIIGQSTEVFGGDHAASFDRNYSQAAELIVGEGIWLTQAGFQVKKFAQKYGSLLNPKAIMIRVGSTNQPSELMAFGAGEDTVNTGSGWASTNPNVACYHFTYNQLNAGWYSLGYGVNYALTNDMLSVSGSTAAAGAGKLAFPTGFRTQVGDSQITRILKGTVAINPASIAANTVSSQTFTLTGAATGDSLTLNPPTAGLTTGLIVLQYFVSASNTITIVFQNTTGSAIDEGSASWNYLIVR